MQQLVISVHGIRTFGDWQERLAELLKKQATDRQITITSYKFGYLSVGAFIIPFFRWLVVRRFRRFLIDASKEKKWDRIDLVGHSFGTHIIAWALYGIDGAKRPPVNTILLAASVLKSNFPWQTLLDHPVKRVVNDCGVKDAILILSQFAVLFTGMAGRLGFNGGTGDNFRNRFFDYGHSDYFRVDGRPDDAFMREYWVPPLLTDAAPTLVDKRRTSALGGIRLMLLNNAEPIKLAVYMTPVVAAFIWINGLYQQADRERARAERERQQAEASFETSHRLLTDFVEVVSEKLQPIAQLATVESLLRSAQGLVEKLPVYNQDDARIALQRVRALTVLAEIRWERGDISGMRALAEQARDIVAPLAQSADSNPEALHILARSTGLIALFHATSQQPDTDRALDLYKQALGQLEQLEKKFDQTRRTGHDWRWLRSLAGLRQGIGDLLLTKLRRTDEADGYYGASIKTFEKLRRLRPTDPEVEFQLAWAINKLGDVLWQRGEDEARGQYEKAAAGIAALGEPRLWENLKWRHALSIVHNNIGLALRGQMHFEEAIAAFEKGETEIKKLLERDPVHDNWLSVLAWTYDNMGETRVRWARAERREERLEGARTALYMAKDIRAQLVQRASDNARWQIEPAITNANVAAYDGTIKEFRKDFLGAAHDFSHAAQLNPNWVNDERSETMILRTIEFHEWAGLAFRAAAMPAAGFAQLKRAAQIAEEHVANAINRKAFSETVIKLNKLLAEPPR